MVWFTESVAFFYQLFIKEQLFNRKNRKNKKNSQKHCKYYVSERMTPILICSNIVLTKKVGFDSGKLFFPIIIQTKSRDLYSKASVVTRKRNTYNISKSQHLTFSYSSSFLYISDLYWTDTRTHFGCNIAHICIRAAERGYIYGKKKQFLTRFDKKKSSFHLYGETVSYHICMMLVLFLRIKEFTKHVIYRKTPPN